MWSLHTNLKVFPLQKVAHFRFPAEYDCGQFPCDFLLLFLWSGVVPFLQSNLALPAEQYQKVDHSFKFCFLSPAKSCLTSGKLGQCVLDMQINCSLLYLLHNLKFKYKMCYIII